MARLNSALGDNKRNAAIFFLALAVMALIIALLAGRLVWGLVSIPIYAMFTDGAFALTAFWMGGFVNAWPGIVLQIVLVPLIVFALQRAKLVPIKAEC